MAHPLTRGSIQKINEGLVVKDPILQVIDLRMITTHSSGDRYRLVLSDGTHFMQGMLASQIGSLVSEKKIQKNSIITLKQFVCNTISGRRVCIVIKCDVGPIHSTQIGSPLAVQPNPARSGSSASGSASGRPGTGRMAGGTRGGFTSASSVNASSSSSSSTGYRRGGAPPTPQPTGSQIRVMQDKFQPVSTLNPYNHGWRIKVRCTSKSTIRTYHNAKGEGKVASVDLLDAEGTEIRATMFNTACDRFYPIFSQGKVYLIAKGRVVVARKQYTHIKNDYSLTLNDDAEVIAVDDSSDIQSQSYKFVNIGMLSQTEPNSYVDVIGCVDAVSQSSTIRTKSDREVAKRTLTIADSSGKVQLTLWDKEALEMDENRLPRGTVIAFKGCRVSDFGGRSLNGGVMDISPQQNAMTGIGGEAVDLGNRLQGWWAKIDGNTDTVNQVTTGGGGGGNAQRMSFEEVADFGMGEGTADDKKADYFSIVATITVVTRSRERPPWYKAEPKGSQGHSKVEPDGRGGWFCAKTNLTHQTYEPRWILRFCANDFSGMQWLTAFHDAGNQIIGKSCEEVERLWKNEQWDEFEDVFNAITFKTFLFKCRVRTEVYQDERRKRFDVLSAQPLDAEKESRYLLDQIGQLTSMVPV